MPKAADTEKGFHTEDNIRADIMQVSTANALRCKDIKKHNPEFPDYAQRVFLP